MKTRYCLAALLALMACTREADLSQGEGYLSVRLSADLAVTPVVKAEAGEPDPVFSLEIIPVAGGETIRVPDYRTLASEPLTLPVGDYTVKAVSGPDTRQSWEEPRYEAESVAHIQPDRTCELALTATLARTMVTAEFDAAIGEYFSDYRVTVSNNSDALVFSRGNGNMGKRGYLKASALEWDLYMVNTQGTAYRVGPVTIENVQPRQHYHFKFTIDEQTRSRAISGAGLLRVLVDDSLNEKYYQLNLDFSGEGLPSITGQDFDLADGIAVKKGDESSHNIVNFSAPRGIKSLTFSHGDDKLLAAGLPQFVQLVDASEDLLQSLSAHGLGVSALSYGETETSIDFGPFLAALPMGDYYLSLDLIDVRNRYSAATVVLSVTSPVEADAISAKPWAEFAILSGRWYTEGRPSGLRFQWRKAGDADWTDYTGDISYNDAAATFSAELYGLQAYTAYNFKTDKEEENRELNFTTAPAGTIPNLNFDDWYQDGKVWYAASDASTRVWDSANKGAASLIGSTTTPETETVVSGKAARMESDYAVLKFAAGNIYIGSFVKLAGMGAELDWGIPFSSRPVALHGYYKYSPVKIDRTESPYDYKKGDMDACSIKMYLCDWSAPFRVNTSESKFLQDDDASIIAMCDFTSNVATSGYVEFTFPLQYRDARTPKYVVIVGAASRLGDYFTGGEGSVLWLDELSLVYDAGALSEEDRALVGYRNL